MTVRYYSSVAPEKTLNGTITSGATTMVVSNTIGLPGSFPYTLAVDYETISEELVEVTNAAGTTLTITRAIDGTSASSHNAGARVRHVTSARDFADSRNHENASVGVHGLGVSEAIVGTDAVQTLNNKTFVNAAGTFLDPDFNLTGTNTSSWSRSPSGASTVQMVNYVNGGAEVGARYNDGLIKVRNLPADDTAVTTRKVQFTMSDGTTERFWIEASGQVVSAPRTGTATSNAGFKVIDPGDSAARRLIKVMNAADTVEQFTVSSGGTASIHTTDPASVGLFIQTVASPTVSALLVFDSASATVFSVNSSGQTIARKQAQIFNDNTPANTVLQVRGNATQSGSLQTWQNSAGASLARVRADGSGDFTSVVTTTGIITAAAGWSVASQTAVVKAGILTLNANMLRTGANIVADPGGDLFGDPPVGTIAAAFRPHAAFAGGFMTFATTNDSGTGSLNMNTTTGDMNLMTWSTDGTLANGTGIRLTMTYPLAFV